MIRILTSYDTVLRFKTHKHIQVTKAGVIVNTKTNNIRKLKMSGGSVGIWLDSRTFVVRSKIKENLELIPKEKKLLPDPFLNL